MADQFDTATASTSSRDEEEFDQYGRYRIPHPVTGKTMSWTRATTWAKSIADTYALTQWQMRMAVKGLALRPDLLALAAATPVEDKEKLNRVAEDAKEAAAASAGANSGTALHAFTEQIDRGGSPFVPPPWDKDIAAYRAALAAHDVQIDRQYIECKVVVPQLSVAGTFDRLVSHRGELVVGDLKTGQNLDYGWLEIAIQLALYARASHLWDKTTRQHAPMPKVSLQRALVFHLPVGQARATVYEVDIATGWEAALLCGQVRDWRKRKGLAEALEPITVNGPGADPILDLIGAAGTVEALTQIWLNYLGHWTATHTAAAAARKNVLLSTGQAHQ